MEHLIQRYPESRLRAGLEQSGLQGTHSYIRGLNADYDRAVLLDRLLQPLPEENDLRLGAGEAEDERWVFMERLPWDSDFFGRGIARIDTVVRPDRPLELRADVAPAVKAVEAALEAARQRGIDYVFGTVAANDLPLIRTLSACGFDLVETRCHYHKPLVAAPEQRHGTRAATAEDVPSLARAARATVNHFDRFHADPEITTADADRLMEKWVHASMLEGFADVTIVPDEPEPEAFCTAKYHRQHWAGWGLKLAQPVLSAVAPRHRGWYVRIISELGEHLRQEGAEHAFLITQITNNAVIRCWEKLGYQFGKGEHVFRKVMRPPAP